APRGSVSPALREERLPEGLKDGALRLVNGVVAGCLGFLLAAQILDGAQAAGVAAGLGVLAYLLPRLGALGVIVALSVLLIRNGTGLGFSALVPVLGGVWVLGAGTANPDVRRLPLGPALAVPLALLGGLGTILGTTLLAPPPLPFRPLTRPLRRGPLLGGEARRRADDVRGGRAARLVSGHLAVLSPTSATFPVVGGD